MKRLHCSFQTELQFSSPITDHTFSFMLTPAETPRQRVLSHQVLVEPHCALFPAQDGFGNIAHMGYSNPPHDHIRYGMEAEVLTDGTRFATAPPNPLCKFATPLTAAGPSVRALWETHRQADAAPESQAMALMHALYSQFHYRSGTTGVRTTAEEALSQGCGVCQDYAHILLALLRLEHIPCRYVTGMMVGEGQTHAWIEVYADGRWLPLDPTHDRIAGEDYVTLSRGRDFDDCSIDKGVFHSKELVTQTQHVLARVTEQPIH